MDLMNNLKRILQGLGKSEGVCYSFNIHPEASKKFEELCQVYDLNKTQLFEKMIEDAISPIHYKGGNMINSRYNPNVQHGILKRY